MATRRVKKKKAQREELELAKVVGQSTPIREVRLREVAVPCPVCGHATMERRYLPMFGGASGSARCPSCTVELPYERVLAHAMGESLAPDTAPLKRAPANPHAVAELAPLSPWRELWVTFVCSLRQRVGTRRRDWSFAST